MLINNISNCRCVITGNGGTQYAYLGRPWGAFGRVVFAHTFMDGCIRHVGWNNWGKPENERTACFYEYRYTFLNTLLKILSLRCNFNSWFPLLLNMIRNIFGFLWRYGSESYFNHKTSRIWRYCDLLLYICCRCFGSGSCPSKRAKWCRQLMDKEAEEFLMHCFIDPDPEKPWLAQRMAVRIPYSA